jgi:hypothetical protein
MPLIRCTRKLLAEIGAEVASSAEPAHPTLLGDWFANLIRIERRKCVVFTSERTLLTFLVVGPGRAAIHDYATLFRSGLRRLLENEGFAALDIDRVVGQYQQMNLAPTNDRSVLGSLNDLARIAVGHVEHLGGLARCDLRAIDHELNITPMSRLKMESPLAVTRRALECGDQAAPASGRPAPQRPKRPGRLDLHSVWIERRGDAAILTPRDPGVAVTHLQVGPRLARMSDEQILELFNATIDAQEHLAAERPYVAIEVPPGQPQIRYFAKGNQWTPRGNVVRCVVGYGDDARTAIYVDDRELSLEEFGRMLSTYEGWGMRIEFTPDDEIERRPRLEVREPEEP